MNKRKLPITFTSNCPPGWYPSKLCNLQFHHPLIMLDHFQSISSSPTSSLPQSSPSPQPIWSIIQPTCLRPPPHLGQLDKSTKSQDKSDMSQSTQLKKISNPWTPNVGFSQTVKIKHNSIVDSQPTIVNPILGAKLLVFSYQGTNKTTLTGGAARDPKFW